jgi:hypothetical protein
VGAFTEYVAAQLRREIAAATIVAKGPLRLLVGDTEASLDRVFDYCNREPTDCAREVATYVRGAAQIHGDRLSAPSKEAVRVLVRTQEYVRATQAALPKDAPKFQPRELVGNLVLLPVIDMPPAVRVLTEKDNLTLGLSADEVLELGLANLRTHLKPLMQVARVLQPRQIGQLSGDAYHSSRLALPQSWSPLARAHGGTLIVAAPTNDTILYVGDDTSAAIGVLRSTVKSVWARAPNQLSSELLRWTPEGWRVVDD